MQFIFCGIWKQLNDHQTYMQVSSFYSLGLPRGGVAVPVTHVPRHDVSHRTKQTREGLLAECSHPQLAASSAYSCRASLTCEQSQLWDVCQLM